MGVRLDLYLHRARLFKSRTRATGACREGRIHLGDRPARASSEVHAGDRLRIREKGLYREILVLELPGKNLSKEAARETWRDVTPEEVRRQWDLLSEAARTAPRRHKAAGRPSKRERRQLERLKGR